MALVKKETPRTGIKRSNTMLLSGTSLASVESLTMPLVRTLSVALLHIYVFLSDFYLSFFFKLEAVLRVIIFFMVLVESRFRK